MEVVTYLEELQIAKAAQRELGMGGFPLQMVPMRSLQDVGEDDEASFFIRANVGVDWR